MDSADSLSASSSSPYRFSFQIKAHESDVRSICPWKNENGSGIISVSRDFTAAIWGYQPLGHDESKKTLNLVRRFTGFEKFVGAVAFGDRAFANVFGIYAPGGLIFTGSNDGHIRVWTFENVSSTIPAAELRGHEKTVSCLCTHPNGFVLSGSWDHTIRAWDSTKAVHTWTGHSSAVWSIVTLPDGTFLSAGADHYIFRWSFDSTAPIQVFQGHEDCVRSIAILSGTDGFPSSSNGSFHFVSTGNDGRVLVWETGPAIPATSLPSTRNRPPTEPLTSFLAHDQFAYSVLAAPSIIADRSSALPVSPPRTIITCGEDKSARIWNLGNQPPPSPNPVQSLQHPAVIWGGAFIPEPSGSESENDCVGNQASTATLPDIAFACADGHIRVWSGRSEREAVADDLLTFEALVASKNQTSSGGDSSGSGGSGSGTVGGVDVSTLPGPDALDRSGRSDGEISVIQRDGVGEVYQWSGADRVWSKIGDLADGPGESGPVDSNEPGTISVPRPTASFGSKSILDGKAYDFVFDVELPNGAKARLGYNRGENPYQVAQQFIWKNDLQQTNLDEIADFIIQGAGVKASDFSNSNTFVDPFTGGSRYVPGGPSGPSGGRNTGGNAAPGVGPKGSSSSRLGANSSSSAAPTASVGYTDPFTGSNRYVPGGSASSSASSASSLPSSSPSVLPAAASFFPKSKMYFIRTGNLAGMRKKLREYGSTPPQSLTATAGGSEHISGPPLSDAELDSLDGLVSVLEQAITADTASGSTSALQRVKLSSSPAHCLALSLVGRLLNEWPLDRLVPVVDLVRLLALCDDAVDWMLKIYPNEHNGESIWDRVLAVTLRAGSQQSSGQVVPPVALLASLHMLGLRFLANGCQNENLRLLMFIESLSFLALIHDVCGTAGPSASSVNVQTALAYYLVNLSVVLLADSSPPAAEACLLCAADVFCSMSNELCRLQCLLTIGNILSSNQLPDGVQKVRTAGGFLQTLRTVAATSPGGELCSAAHATLGLIQ